MHTLLYLFTYLFQCVCVRANTECRHWYNRDESKSKYNLLNIFKENLWHLEQWM